jgi:hypothetical protein
LWIAEREMQKEAERRQKKLVRDNEKGEGGCFSSIWLSILLGLANFSTTSLEVGPALTQSRIKSMVGRRAIPLYRVA